MQSLARVSLSGVYAGVIEGGEMVKRGGLRGRPVDGPLFCFFLFFFVFVFFLVLISNLCSPFFVFNRVFGELIYSFR